MRYKKELKALASAIYTIKHKWCTKEQKQIIRGCIKGNFERLDHIGVPYPIQNKVIQLAENKQDYNQYIDEVTLESLR